MKKIFLILFLLVLNFVFIPNKVFSEEQNIYTVAYLNRLEKKVKLNWILPHGQTDKTTIISFKIDKNGNVLVVNISNSSGDNTFDQTALTAIYKSVPFEEIPACMQDNSLNISYKFNQNDTKATLVSELFYQNHPEQTTNLTPEKAINNDQFRPYLQYLQIQIKQNWHPDKYNISKKCVAMFEINKKGELNNLKIFQSSDNQSFDAAALDAITKTAPFKPLPDFYKENHVTVQFNFDYNVFNKNTNAQYNFADSYDRAYLAYQKTVDAIISHSVPKQLTFRDKCLILRITIEPSGCLKNVQILHSSNDKYFDNLYVSAIKKCSFPPLNDKISSHDFTYNYIVQTKHQNYNQINMVPADLSTPAGKIWAFDKVMWWIFLGHCICHIH